MKTYLKVCVVILGIITLQSFAQQTAEQDFINKSVMSNRFEIAMAEQAIEKSNSAATKAYARELVADHQKILAELEAYAQSKGLTIPQEMGREHQSRLESLAALNKDRYDQVFQETAVTSHEKSIALFEQAGTDNTTEDDGFRSWINDRLPSLRSH
ncbi:DUF4142 domain-containing protein [Sphingobacterium sp. SGG-5]|uniref:DUF4142 domain-containing protein n=1 Tax=Sphingobacterium sp. SGG-5 TaxID=2710881 RepID=UPI0013EDE139|nr:DUF4142 domain-containing protein [Sphingobacterium sp. SGG-5]NGM61028.1 DUF4142 domain-containing protein [Sphingobacterium sp. SGG-5]